MTGKTDSTLSRGRALGLAFLFALFPAIVIGGGESYLSLHEYAPTFWELAYGAYLHLLMAAAAVCCARILLWNAAPARFVPAAIGIYYLVEICFTGVLWFMRSPWAPPLAGSFGKLFAAVCVAVAFTVGVVMVWLLVRCYQHIPWAAKTASWRGPTGGALLTILFLCTLFFVIKHYATERARTGIVQNANILPDASPDVIFILVDALRYDHVSYNGYSRPTTPHIDSLMRESYVFRNAYTPSNKTVPSIISYFTGLSPSSHRVGGPFQGFPSKVPTLAEHFKSYGYRTAAFVGNGLVSVRRGFDRGFDRFSPRGMPWWCYHGRTGVETFLNYLVVPRDAASGARINRELFSWLDSFGGGDGARFIYLHYMEPHSYYEPPPEHYNAVAEGVPPGPKEPPMFHEYASGVDLLDWESLPAGPVVSEADRRGMVARYDGEVHLADWYVGEVLRELRTRNRYDNAHIIFLTDHGEEFGDHGGWFHGHSIYDELTRCPLAYRPPGGVKTAGAGAGEGGGVSVERPIAVLDFMLTLFELLETDPMPLWQGELVPELFEAGRVAARTPVVSSLPPQLYSLRYGPWKLIRRGEPDAPIDLLFNLSADPREYNNLAPALPDTLAVLRDLLEDTIAEREKLSIGELESTVDPETLERLRSLGYIQ